MDRKTVALLIGISLCAAHFALLILFYELGLDLWISNFLALVPVFVILAWLKINYTIKIGPPGPTGWPFVGKLIELSQHNAILKCQEYAAKYGPIFSMRVGNFNVVVITDHRLMREAMKNDDFQGRPDFMFFRERNGGVRNRGILLSDSTNWQEQRRFALKTLRDFGFGKQSMENFLLHEAHELVAVLRNECKGKTIALKHMFNSSVFNSLWYMLSGQRFDVHDAEFQRIMSLVAGHLEKEYLFNPASYFPWPNKYNLIRRGLWKKSMRVIGSIFDLMDGLIKKHLNEYDDSKTDDYIDAYLHKHMKPSDESSFMGTEGIQNLRVSLVDLFQAGTETTSTTLVWAVLFMCKDLKIQEKLHEEVDRIIGFNRMPSREDRSKMPYLEAFTNEVHRKATLVPMTVFHRTLKDTKLAGYRIIKDTVILPSIYAAHHDKGFWGDPEVFRPERFLDASGTKVLIKEALMPFATGKRMCLGETLARDTLFIFLAVLLQSFSFKLDPDYEDIDVSIPSGTLIGFPKDFKVAITPRN